MLKLGLDASLCFESFYQGCALGGGAAKPFVERPDLLFHVGEAENACVDILSKALQFILRIFDIGNQFDPQSFMAIRHRRHDVGCPGDLSKRVFPLQDQHLDAEVLVAY